MASLKWIYCAVLFELILSDAASPAGSGTIVFPTSDEDIGNSLQQNYKSKWQIGGSSGSKTPIKTIKTSSYSTRTGFNSEPLYVRYNAYNTGSSAQANANSMNYNFQPGMFNAPPGYGGSFSGSSASASSSSFSYGGVQCTSEPKPPANGRMKCASGSCQVSCLADYKFPNGADTLILQCMNGRWIAKSFETNDIPPCEPVCLPACVNKGICVAPGQCKCPENFMGPTCQYEKKLCLTSPPLPANSKRSCSQSLCTVSCMKGYKFPDGSLSMNLQCMDGEWKPEQQSLKLIPDCEPICDPACLNGGKCLSYNVCQCGKEFRGPQCQWGIDRCATTKLNFNGGFSCSGSADAIKCKLICPKTVKFSFEPAEFYTCLYSTGEFTPNKVPQCVFPPGMKVTQSKPIRTYSQTNGTLIKSGGEKSYVVEVGGQEEIIEETETIIKRKIIRKGKKKTYTVDEDEEFFEAPGVYSLYIIQDLEVTYKTPKPSVCMAWNGNKFKTFDGVTYSHELACSHTLLQDFVDGTFNVILRACPFDSIQPCPHALEVFMQNEQFTFENNGGHVKMFTTKREIPIPVQMTGLKVTRSGTDVRIILEQIPITITWDSKKFIQIDATESMWNRTAGLCGTMDGIMSNDFMSKDRTRHKLASTFVDSWRALNIDKSKEKCLQRSQAITSIACETSIEEKANLVCTDLLKNPKMKNCLKMFDDEILMKNCISDYCSCKNGYDRTECICEGFSAIAKDCRFRGIMLEDGWRDWQICPLNCTNGRVYKSCGPLNEPSCGSAIESDSFNCREGCFCPDGTILNDGTCVMPKNCPCNLKGKSFPPKSQIKRDCNTCVCDNGNWKCTSVTCGSRCAAIGDPHYMTFDGKRYDFMGKCSYYLMKTESISVEAENVACDGAISENMNFLPSFSNELPSCTKSLTIKFNDVSGQPRIIKLKQGGFVLLDGFEVSKLPVVLSNGAVKIRQPSSSFVIVHFVNGATIWWDGATRAYIDVPASYRGKTQGLCGTFNSNMQDDFLTPEGDIETVVYPFANKWQTKDSCDSLNDKLIAHPCDANIENKAKAEEICSKLRDKIFEECHLFVDPEEFYSDCMYDVCACKGNDISQCFCPIFAAYATECTRQGIVLEWRYKISQCAINCPNGQVFQQCGEACTRTCSDLQSETECQLQCVEGCRCPMGQVLDENNECVTIAMCKCSYKNLEFKPGYKEVRPGRKYLELCTCYGGRWKCVEATGDDEINYPAASDMSKKCSASRNEIFTTCEPAEPLTCKNMHLNVSTSTALCRPGCMCKDGYVLDRVLKQCVLPEKCSCHHGGRSYSEGEHIKEDCNTCLCKGGIWDCTMKACASTCSAWGDSHFTTFDGREFDFQGVCSYVLSKGKLHDGDGFSVTIQNVLCGSNGVTCSKSLEINLLGNEMESLSLSSDLPVPGIKNKLNAKPLQKMLTYRSGIFIVVEIPHIGVILKWDRGTRVYLKLENRWKGKVQGLCGNYNYDALDDFMNPSNGVESNPIIFGHSWKLEDSCAVPTEQVDSCALNPQRKTWAQRKCGLLKSLEFAQCHSEVSVDSFYKRCIFDTCSCDQGGDCECLCTALSAYAFACSSKGIFIRWRTPDLCPMQCDPTCSNYHPCIQPCPAETCDNLMHPLKNQRLCNADVCVEGCKLKECPEGSVYMNNSYSECIPTSSCKPICLEENGVTYYEGDIMASDSCHTCKCTRGNKVCSGLPCAISVPDGMDGDIKCQTGWSAWINQDMLEQSAVKSSKSNYFKEDDIEPLPNNMQMKNLVGKGKAVCSTESFAAIECRSVIGRENPKKTGQNVECSLEKGLICKGQCFDYEIRVYCECDESSNVITTIKPQYTIAAQPKPTQPAFIVPVAPTKAPISFIKVCDPNIPNVEHPLSCKKFLQCVQSENGSYIYAEKTCGDSMMFNPKVMVCDWPANVIKIKPKCEETETPQNDCPTGYAWSDCAIPCTRACNYYSQQLKLAGNCTAGKECIPGCLPEDSALTCKHPKLWRDWKSCVDIQSCTCMGPNNEIMKPGQVVYVSECKTCQCLNNEYICANVPCKKTVTTSRPVDAAPTVQSKKIAYYLTICDPSVPHIEHPNSCYKFLHCQPAPDGSYMYAVKTCYPDMMFNPNTMICDWPDSVKKVKPACGVDVGEIDIWEYEEVIITRNKTSHISGTTQRSIYDKKVTTKPGYIVESLAYYIRVCNPSVVSVEHPESCYKYLACEQIANGSYMYAEKECGSGLMYNPNILVCDWPSSVEKIKPTCSDKPTTLKAFDLVKETQPPFVVTGIISHEITKTAYYLTMCDPSVPHIEHPNSCYKFLHCQPAANGSFIYAVKTCYPDMMFHPKSMVCEWPESVKAIKPKCGSNPGEIEIWEYEEIKISRSTIRSHVTTPKTIIKYTESPSISKEVIHTAYYLTMCDPSVPRIEHPNSCYKYLECQKAPNGSFIYAVKTCYPNKMFNPNSKLCDTPNSLKNIKPKCNVDPGEIEIWEYEEISVIRRTSRFPTATEKIVSISSTERPEYGFGGIVAPYYIRTCNPTIAATIEHPETCHKYLECVKLQNGSYIYAEKTCGPDLLYNAEKEDCDWPFIVEELKPNCKEQPGVLDWTTVTPRPATYAAKPTEKPYIVPSTITPPEYCEDGKLVPLLHLIPDSAFESSSILSKAFKPEAARLDTKSSDENAGSWSPKTNDLNQYLQVTFPQSLPIHGVIIRGNSMFDQYVTSFKILYSHDGTTYHVLEDKKKRPKIFSGSVDPKTPVKSIFEIPIEAKMVRIYPISWHGSIALRVELLGCETHLMPITFAIETTTTSVYEFARGLGERTTTTSSTTTTRIPIFTEGIVEPLCDDPLGIENSAMSPNQITFSSIKDAGSVKTKVRKNPLEIIKLSSTRGWMPLTVSMTEYVLFDFIENRKLTGIVTKGGEYGWVKSFNVLYSQDNIIWNKIEDDSGDAFEFLANVDAYKIKKNFFKSPVNARYMKIQPTKWHSTIELKIEPIGCFVPYPVIAQAATTKPEVEIVTPSTCGVCKGILAPRPVRPSACTCYPPLYWSGSECVPQSQCPCVEGHMIYEIGETYQTEDCADCICKIGGVPDCKPKVCAPCGQGLRRESPKSCSCQCVPCPPDTILCQTSGECIPESSWCDGVQDCPDDEKNCIITEKPMIFVNRTETLIITKKCPDPSCPPGFKIKAKKSKIPRMMTRFSEGSDEDDDDDDDDEIEYTSMIKAKYERNYQSTLPISEKIKGIESEHCVEFICVPIVESPDYAEEGQRTMTRCPEPKCPRGYMIRLQIQKDSKECAKFSCEAAAVNDAVCNVTGRTFNTFDFTEFKYDICNHLLARDAADEKWNVIMKKNCSSGNNICRKEIVIKDKVSMYTLTLYPSLTVNLDGYPFTVEQLQKTNRKMTFTVSKNGGSLLYVSHTHGIWLMFDRFGDVKFGVSGKYSGNVDGLCGFFNRKKTDDKRMPNGKVASSTVEFGDSWSLKDVGQVDCKPHVCQKTLQDVAWTICNLVKDNVFKSCHAIIDPTSFISKCMETACDCLLTSSNASSDLDTSMKECKCSMLQNYVVDCMAADEAVHLETWRSVHSCEASCESPFVHHDCYRRKCETTCNNLRVAECSKVTGTCFSGCYCPSGTVLKDSTCIPISECRDCVCDGFGKSQYLTYDRKNFTFDGNCTYLLTRDISLKNIHTFQVFATIGPCDAKSQSTCTQALHLIYGNHIIHIEKSTTNSFKIIVDGMTLKSLPFNQKWAKIAEQGKSLSILLPESQVELQSVFETMSFSIKVPSVKYGSKMEGMCGNCNGNPNDDIITNPAKTDFPKGASPMEKFALSWLADEPKLQLSEDKDTCYVDDESDCLPLPPEDDPCFKILDEDIFGQCHFVVDPIMYVTSCQQDLCRTGPSQKGSCETVATYADECAKNGVCVDWRKNNFCTMDCVAPFVYSSCGCSETCKTIEEKQMKLSSIKDAKNAEKLKSICSTTLREGCFCPNGTVLHNGNCIKEVECKVCDDEGHLPGDIWHPDVCTSCSCRSDASIQCQKTECPSQQTICEIGYKAIESSTTGECCKKYACVPDIMPTKPTSCPQLVLPKCGFDQTNKIINDTDGCSKFICDCIPKEQCKSVQNFPTLEPGIKQIIDTTGCCPVSKLECDKSLCPAKPSQCSEAFYTLEKIKSVNAENCCDMFECRPPSHNCIADIEGKKVLKPIDEKWQTNDICETAVCAFDTNGKPIIKKQRETCNTRCQLGFELKPIPDKCCGQCVKTKCVVDKKLYNVGAEWKSADNCTTFICNIKDDEIFISSMMPTCSDVSNCPPLMRYTDGCCEKCKLESLSQQNCLPESLAEKVTLGLIKTQIPPHGKCQNFEPIRGVTQCSGTCKSGTIFDPITFHQLKSCDCCSVSSVKEIAVELVCEDKYKLIKHFNVPSSCACSKCGADDIKSLKLTASS